jgi:putative oxygen-independent coproporphyrinogen III oxidase
MKPAPELALYVHMPWCVSKCPYCDFNSHQLKSGAPDSGYIDALLEDLRRDLDLIPGRRIDSVFFGGGTPSLFAPQDFDRFFRRLRELATLAGDAEITLEANPGTIERGAFSGYRDAGVTRISLGAQSFSADALHRLGRIHDVADTERAVVELKAAGLFNFNLDLMYGLPGQTPEQAIHDVTRACALEPRHISHYQLTLEPGTVFAARPPSLPDEDTAWDMQLACQGLLAEYGFEQYEVSAYARPGYRCRHNVNYWKFGDYLGIGAGAHGKVTVDSPEQIVRTEKPKQPRDYLRGIAASDQPIGSRKFIAVRDLPFEYMLNALRLNEGFAAFEYVQRTGLALDGLGAGLAANVARGLLDADSAGWRPSEMGRRFLNDLQASFLA